MKITVTTSATGNRPNTRVLGDDANGMWISGFLPASAALVQTEAYPGSEEVEVFSRGNITTRFAFTVKRTHLTHSAALLWMATECSEVAGLQGRITVAHADGFGGSSQTMADGVVASVRHQEHIGLHTLTEYQCEGGRLLKTVA